MFGVYDEEKIEFRFIGESEDGIGSKIKEIIDFTLMDDDPFKRNQKMIQSYALFLTKLGISVTDYYFSIMQFLESNNILDIFHKYVKEEDIMGLYEELSRFNFEDDLKPIEDANPLKASVKNMLDKMEEINYSEFESRCLKDESFRKYLYQVYLDDNKE